MTIKANAAGRVICVALLAFAFALGTCRAAAAEEDPEVRLCKLQCRRQQQFDERDKEQCVQACDEYGRMKEEIERRGKGEPPHHVEPPEKKREQCVHECRAIQQISEDQRRQCERRCQEKYEEERNKAPGHHGAAAAAAAGRRQLAKGGRRHLGADEERRRSAKQWAQDHEQRFFL